MSNIEKMFEELRPIIRIKAYKVYIHGQETEDIVQELSLAFCRAYPKYTGENGASPRTFFESVFNNKIKELIRGSKAQKRSSVSFSELGQE
jgi:RNA polymerase sigma factor (sigma-70 family)